MKKIIAIVSALIVSLTSADASMMDNGSWSLGYQAGYTGDYLQGISTRVWYDKNGFEGNCFIANVHGSLDGDKADLTLYELEGKYMRSLVINKNSRFYVGLGAGYGKIDGSITDDGDKDSETMDTLLVKPLFGAEFNFAEIPELGINFEVSYGFTFWDIDDVDIRLSSIAVGIGMHYYFQ